MWEGVGREGTDLCSCSLLGRWLSVGQCPARLLLPGPLAFRETLLMYFGREDFRILDRAQCIMNKAVMGVSIAVIMRLRSAAAGGIEVDCLLSLYAFVSSESPRKVRRLQDNYMCGCVCLGCGTF